MQAGILPEPAQAVEVQAAFQRAAAAPINADVRFHAAVRGAAVLLRGAAGAEGGKQAAHGKRSRQFLPVGKRQMGLLTKAFEGLKGRHERQRHARRIDNRAFFHPLPEAGAGHGRQTRGKDAAFRQGRRQHKGRLSLKKSRNGMAAGFVPLSFGNAPEQQSVQGVAAQGRCPRGKGTEQESVQPHAANLR